VKQRYNAKKDGFIVKYTILRNSEEKTMAVVPNSDLVTRANSGDIEALKELASLFVQSDDDNDKRKGYLLYQKANDVSNNDPIIIGQLGNCLYNGIGTEKDEENGLQMFKKAAEIGTSVNQSIYAGVLKRRNDPECLEWYERIYNEGQMPYAGMAAHSLATIFHEGVIVGTNDEKYRDYLQKAANLGEHTALQELGRISSEVELDVNTPEKNKEAISSLEKLANEGSLDAAKKLADIFSKGEYVPKDTAIAAKWAGKAATNGDPQFAYDFKLQNAYDRITCLEPAASVNHFQSVKELAFLNQKLGNIEKAQYYYIKLIEMGEYAANSLLKELLGTSDEAKLKYYALIKTSADSGNATTCLEMYNIYYDGVYTAKDDIKAKEYLDRSVKGEDPWALYILSSYYDVGSHGFPQDYSLALSYMMKAEEKKPGLAATSIGDYYLHGVGVQQNIETAKSWYKKAIQYNDKDGNAYHALGLISEKDEYGIRDYGQALEYYKKAHELGNFKACIGLAGMYEKGLGVEADLSKKIYYLKEAAALSSKGVLYAEVGRMTLKGEGTEKDPILALEYLEKAVDLGCNDNDTLNFLNEAKGLCTPQAKFERYIELAKEGNHKAEFELSIFYSDGYVIPQDNAKAMDYLKKSAEGGYVRALDRLGEVEIGRLNYILAVEWWEKAFQNGSYQHSFDLAKLYFEGQYGIQQNTGRAVEIIKTAALMQNKECQRELGALYFKGTGVEQNNTEAFNWTSSAANAGDALAQRNLGNFYKNGTGCVRDPYRALEWYQKSADQGNAEAKYAYAYMLYKGDGVVQNLTSAAEYYKQIIGNKRVMQNDIELYKAALYDLGSIYTDQRDYFSAFPLWKEGADLDVGIDQYNLGVFYYNGWGTSKDLEKAKSYLSRADVNGVAEARNLLNAIRQDEERLRQQQQLEQMQRNQQSAYEYAQRVQRRGCYVATAVYGSYDCPEVWVLRRFRDNKLSLTQFGRAFIKIYYTVSPTCVKCFGNTKWFNKVFKSILDKKVEKLREKGYSDKPYYDED